MISPEAIADLALSALRQGPSGARFVPEKLSAVREALKTVPSGKPFYEAVRELSTVVLFIEQKLGAPEAAGELVSMLNEACFPEAEKLRAESADLQDARVASAARRFEAFAGRSPETPLESDAKLEAELPKLIPG